MASKAETFRTKKSANGFILGDHEHDKSELINMTIACVASVSAWFRGKERPRNGILGFGRARNETRAIFERSLTIVPRSLLLNHTVTLATQAT